MKRIRWVALGLCLCLVFALTACAKGAAEPSGDPTDKPGTPEPAGTLTIEDVRVWKGYPAVEFFPVFSVESEAEELVYEYDDSVIEVDAENNLISTDADGAGVTVVKAKGERYTAEFSVYYGTVDKSGSWYQIDEGYTNYARSLSMLCAQNGTEGKTTVFMGDSFFDTRYFWTDFNTVYKDYDALCCGISSTTSYDWETLAGEVLGGLKPANIAIHIGTNNVYDDKMDQTETTQALQRLFLVLHDLLPETNIYYFSITQRADTSYATTVSRVNDDLAAWCAPRDWITWLDTTSKLTTDKLKDGIHPKLENYSIFVEALEEARMPLYLKQN